VLPPNYPSRLPLVGEDLPDADRKIPTDPATPWACIVCYPSCSGRSPGLLSLQALVRGCFALLCSFYYDNATFQDWESTAVSSQDLVEQVMSLLGNPFATAKRQGPSVSGDFLGLVDDFSPILDGQRIHVWV